MEITVKRSGHYHCIFADGKRVGEAFKFTQASGFDLRLNRVYWRRGEVNFTGGSTVGAFPRLVDALIQVKSILERQSGHN